MKNSILLTGGSGYIGKHIYTFLIKEYYPKYNIILYDLVNNDDLCNYNNLDAIFKYNNIKYVIHLASFKNIEESINDPIKYYYNNILSTLNLLKIMQNNNCYNIIFSSSASIYGNQKSPIIEASISNNLDISPYSKTKLYIENILNDLYNSNNKWNIIILRYFNPVGYNTNSGIFYNLINSYINNTTFYIYGNNYHTRDGTCIRDFIHIDDLVNSHIISLEYIINNKNIFKIYNVGTGHGYTIKEIVNNFNNILKNKNLKSIHYEFTNNRLGDIPISFANVDKINKELKWYAIKDVNSMLNDTLEYYIKK
jgi:UDP-glucose 4-epimerase